jgi:hypothetical protein
MLNGECPYAVTGGIIRRRRKGSIPGERFPSSCDRNVTGQEMGQRARDERLEVITTELRQRIRPVCPDMPEELFFEMIERMAAIQLKYELIEDAPPS